MKIILIFIEHFFYSLHDSTQKYVIDCNFVNHFLVLSIEGFFGFLITLGYLLRDVSYKIQLFLIYSESSGTKFSLFILLLFFYLILCGGKNAFRVITHKIYSPMTTSLTDYFLNPLYLTINYLQGDFISSEEKNVIFFLINFILSLIISLCGCIFNEIIILYFCELETNTYEQISFRSYSNYKKGLFQLSSLTDDKSSITEDSN